MRNLRCHADALTQRGVRVYVADGEDVGHVGAHLDVDVGEASIRYCSWSRKAWCSSFARF
jgi:hypothetical protein